MDLARLLAPLALLAGSIPLAAQGCPNPAAGPDLVVGGIDSVAHLGGAGGVGAYSLGTKGCNGGDAEVGWVANTTQHPVITFNAYRLEDGRFEQIGMSWARHGFVALQGIACCPCTPAANGSMLGVGCSTVNSAFSNSNQASLGPRSEVDASTGAFPFPFTDPGLPNTVTHKRLQIASADLDPTAHPTARWFVEAHYVAPDDATAGNGANNAAWREVTPTTFTGASWNLTVIGAATTEQSALAAWPALDADAAVTEVQVPADGAYLVGDRVSDNGDGTWRYEYAVHNRDSHASAGGFRVALPAGTTVSNVGFHDVAYHSGEPYDSTDWVGVHAGDEVVWNTTSFAVDPDANALRWSTLYNFRFDADRPPGPGTATIELFRPHVPQAVTAGVRAPSCPGGVVATETVRTGSPANPAALLVGVTSRPVLGATWDPVVDHASFYPDATLDFLAVQADGVPLNVPLGIGTLLCNVPTSDAVFLAAPGTPFAVPVPADCALNGRPVCAQGGSLGGSLGLRLASGLDLVLGAL